MQGAKDPPLHDDGEAVSVLRTGLSSLRGLPASLGSGLKRDGAVPITAREVAARRPSFASHRREPGVGSHILSRA